MSVTMVLPCHCIICLIEQDKHKAQYLSLTPDKLISIVSEAGDLTSKKSNNGCV